MIQSLLVLNSSYTGSRDLVWTAGEDQGVIGYNVYRAYDAPIAWTLLTPTPLPITFYRDQTTFQLIPYTVQPSDWVSFGLDGSYVLKVPDAPIWGQPTRTHPTVANNPMDVQVTVDGQIVPVLRVDGPEGLVYLQHHSLKGDGAVTEGRSNSFLTPGAVPSNVVVVTYRKLINYVDIYLAGPGNSVRTLYTVVPVLTGGVEAHPAGLIGSEMKTTYEVDSMDYMFAEMVRRNAWLFEQSGEPSNLMIRRTKGLPCGCLVGNNEPRHGCNACYETGIIGGYFGPFEMLFIDPDVAATRTINEGGVKVERQSRSFLGPTPLVQNGDMIVRRNGERLVISDVVYKSPRGVLLQQDFNVSLLGPNDTRYTIPLLSTQPPAFPPTLYDPRFTDGMALPAEPVTDPTTDPTKQWDNPKVPKGRSPKFGNIQT